MKFPVFSLLNGELTPSPSALEASNPIWWPPRFELAGGVTAVAKLCGVARQSVYT